VGVATQDPRLREKFTGDPAHVVHFMRFIATEVRELMAELGFRRLQDMVGRSDCLETKPAVDHWKARGLDFSAIFHRPDVGDDVGRYCQIPQDHGLEESLDKTTLLELCKPALERGEKVAATLPIRNRNRVVGTILGSEITRRHGPNGLPDDTIQLTFQGSAGQSFGAFIPKGLTLILEGDTNDYVGKGLSGGRIVVYPSRGSSFVPEQNMIVGNVALYGATAGEAFFYGAAGERFAVRNSGVNAVVEAVGDHGCEYMTGGRVVVLGPTGRNFAAGMSGGIAYVLDEDDDFAQRCNKEMVLLYRLRYPEEIDLVKDLIFRHAQLTGSTRASKVLVDWDYFLPRFVRVVPNDYNRVLQAQRRMRETGLSPEEAEMAAFELNAQDVARVGGK
jgi:glutamate synthase (ferredoxin)